MSKEKLILKELCRNEVFSRKVLPFVKQEYFSDVLDKKLFQCIHDLITNYKKLPSKEALIVSAEDISGIKDDQYEEILERIELLHTGDVETNIEWLVDETEKFCKDSALYNAISESIDIQNGSNSKLSKEAIPDILKTALAVSFDSSVGHNFFADAPERFEWYNQKVYKIPFELDMFNKITEGGVERKSLNVVAGMTGAGKTMFLTYLAASYIRKGFKTLYITLEMSEEKISHRIDANLLQLPMSEVPKQMKTSYNKQIASLREKYTGDLFVKEFPTASANVNHFRHLLSELELKQKFVPEIIIVDYLSIASSVRIKDAGSMYSYVKSIAEELRGLAVERDVCIWSASQFNRSGYSSDPGLEDVAESAGLSNTVDMLIAAVRTEELDEENKIMFKQLKSRYGDISMNRSFVVGNNRSQMNYYNIDNPTLPVENDVVNVTEFNKKGKKKLNVSGFKM